MKSFKLTGVSSNGPLTESGRAWSRDEFAHFRTMPRQRFVKSSQQSAVFLSQCGQIKVIPLAVARHGSKRHGASTVQVRRNELATAPLRNQTHQTQRFGRRVQRRKNPVLNPARGAQNLKQRKLGQRRDRERTPDKETMSAFVVFVLRNDERGQAVGIQQVGHPSFNAAATSSAVIGTPSLRASGIPWRILALAGPLPAADKINEDAAASSVILCRRERDFTARAAAGLRSKVNFTVKEWHSGHRGSSLRPNPM